MTLYRVAAPVAIGAAALTAAFVGCADDTHDADGHDPSLADVIYEGGATDEALAALTAAEVKQDAAKAAHITWPSNNEAVAPDPPIAFWWEVTQARRPKGVDPRWWREPRRAPSGAERAFALLLPPVLGPVRDAHAHGTPISGPAYFLVLSTEDDPKLVRVFTTALTYTPDADTWAKLKGAAKPITAVVTWADFDTNRVVQGGGPWQGEPITITIRTE
jgi:hypothetical protein